VDLAYLRAHPEHLQTFLTHQRIRETPVGGGAICEARRLTLEDGASVFAKSLPDGQPVPPGFFEAEARGLTWLAEAGAVSVPELIVAQPNLLALAWVEPAGPTPAAAERFGRELARLHRAGADGYGAAWPGYIGRLPLDNGGGPAWPEWFARRRLEPYLRLSADRQALSGADVALVERVLAGIDRFGEPPEGPSRLHGDLWPGNLLWAADRVWLVDPAAHGGHRESDLSQLALFGGPPHWDRILAGYDEEWPLAAGWADRVGLHQLHLLLVHSAMFGASYRDAVVRAAESALRA
jgi:fructosamine-3-kinase